MVWVTDRRNELQKKDGRHKVKLAFVILNFGTYAETTDCVSSIVEHIDIDDYKIVIVDNGSKDDSLERLQKKYWNNERIDVISTGDNLGFAQGNNVGIKYVNENYSPDFVVVLNSDIELFQDELYARLLTEYKHSHFGVWGPMMIIGTARCDDSPWVPMSLTQAREKLEAYEKKYQRLEHLPYFLYRAVNKIASTFIKQRGEQRKHEDFWRYQTDVELQGAFLVFSKEMFQHIKGFDPRTFLYYEEQLLYLAVKRTGMKMVYDPRYAVYHKDGVSTKKIKSSKSKLLFLQYCNIESLKILITEMEKEATE